MAFLASKGFVAHSLSDVIREEVAARGGEMVRENFLKTGRELRTKHGAGVLAERILARLTPDQNHVVDSFRHPSEVEAFRGRQGFRLLVVRADAGTRFERLRRRARENDPLTREGFDKLEAAEATSRAEGGQDLGATEVMADDVVENNGTIEDLHAALSDLIPKLMTGLERPGWDEYFMRIAKVAALRSNCIKRKVAAVIVRDRRVITTGYNGTPRGTKNCYEGGCPRCNTLADSGTRLEECLCSHGEENAITQAAYHGVSVRGATLYTTFAPCLMCTKMIINAGICEVVYNTEYPLNDTAMDLLAKAGVACRRVRVP